MSKRAGEAVDSPLIEFVNLSKIYSDKGAAELHALNGISLQIPRGQIHGIIGQSGAGKSTLIRCMTALEKPTSGKVTVDGIDMTSLSTSQLRKSRRNIGMVFQNANLLDARTAGQNIAYPLKLAGVKSGKRHDRVRDLLDLVGLAGRGDSYPSQLSGGQRQRVGIARALADDPPVLLCDEPTSALDMESTRQILSLIREVRDQLKVTVVIITHEMAVVREACDAATLLEDGRIVESGTLEDIVLDTNSRLSRDLVPAPTIDFAEITRNGDKAIDLIFNSRPGKPTGAAVLSLVASLGADVAGGVFETLGMIQIGRLALTVSEEHVDKVLNTLHAKGFSAERRTA